jgi:hypothetical protein
VSGGVDIGAGDIVEQIGNTSTHGLDNQRVSELLRGKAGTTVSMRVRRQVAVAPPPRVLQAAAPSQVRRFQIRRETIRLHPVVAHAFRHESAGVQHTVGYVKLMQFSERSGAEMQKAVDAMERAGADGAFHLLHTSACAPLSPFSTLRRRESRRLTGGGVGRQSTSWTSGTTRAGWWTRGSTWRACGWTVVPAW